MEFDVFQTRAKAELHVHLEGSFTVERALALAVEQPEHPWATLTPKDLRGKLGMRDFDAFIEQFMLGYRLLETREHFRLVTEDLCAQLVRQGVTHAQVLYSPGVSTQRMGRRLEDIHDGIEAGLAAFPQLNVMFILDTVINLGPAFMTRTLEAVLADRRPFIGGFSIGGGLADLDMATLKPVFDRADAAGLYCVAHAGEVDGPENVRYLIEHTAVRRIAHACRAVEDPALLALMAARNIAVEVCITSNLCTRVVEDLAHHPIHAFAREGVPFTLSTDDPFYFDTTLHREYELATELLGLSDQSVFDLMDRSLALAKLR